MADQEQAPVITNVVQAQALVNLAAEQADPPDVVNEAAPPDVPPPLVPHPANDLEVCSQTIFRITFRLAQFCHPRIAMGRYTLLSLIV
jgi:hypothetical protein